MRKKINAGMIKCLLSIVLTLVVTASGTGALVPISAGAVTNTNASIKSTPVKSPASNNIIDVDKTIFVGEKPQDAAQNERWCNTIDAALKEASIEDTILLKTNLHLSTPINIEFGTYAIDLGGCVVTADDKVTPIVVSGGNLELSASGGGRITGGAFNPVSGSRESGASAVLLESGTLLIDGGRYIGGNGGGQGLKMTGGKLAVLKGSFVGGSGSVKNGNGIYIGTLDNTKSSIRLWNASIMAGNGRDKTHALQTAGKLISDMLAPTANITVNETHYTVSELSSTVLPEKGTVTIQSQIPNPPKDIGLPIYANKDLTVTIPNTQRTVTVTGFLAPKSTLAMAGISAAAYEAFLKEAGGDKSRLLHVFSLQLIGTEENGSTLTYPFSGELTVLFHLGKEYAEKDITLINYNKSGKISKHTNVADKNGAIAIKLSQLGAVGVMLGVGVGVDVGDTVDEYTSNISPIEQEKTPDPLDDLVPDSSLDSSGQVLLESGNGIIDTPNPFTKAVLPVMMGLVVVGTALLFWVRLLKKD